MGSRIRSAAIATLVTVIGSAMAPASAIAASADRSQPAGRTVAITFAPVTPASGAMLDTSARLIRQRVIQLGLPATYVTVTGRHIVVTGKQTDEAVLRSLAVSGVLRFRSVLLAAPPRSKPHGDKALAHADVLKLFNRLSCKPGSTTPAGRNAPDAQIVSCGGDGTRYALATAAVLGDQVTAARAEYYAPSSQWEVLIAFNRVGAAALGKLTTRLYNRYYAGTVAGNADDAVLDEVAIVVDGSVVSSPEIYQPITSGEAEIDGNELTQARAEELAAQLRSGHLPVSLKVVDVRTFAHS